MPDPIILMVQLGGIGVLFLAAVQGGKRAVRQKSPYTPRVIGLIVLALTMTLGTALGTIGWPIILLIGGVCAVWAVGASVATTPARRRVSMPSADIPVRGEVVEARPAPHLSDSDVVVIVLRESGLHPRGDGRRTTVVAP